MRSKRTTSRESGNKARVINGVFGDIKSDFFSDVATTAWFSEERERGLFGA